MKTLVILFVSAVALVLSGCAEQPLISDEEYNARRGPAANAPDYSAYLPQTSNRPPGY
jgi:outer membrane lipoprotein SlyB